jgi:predicted O-methyltransferase YrrM
LRFFEYLKFRFSAGNAHGLHSPFVFELYTRTILAEDDTFYCFEAIEHIRDLMLFSDKTLIVKDLGAGSKADNHPERKVSDIARHAQQPPRLAQLLFRLVNEFNPFTIFDLGTSLGITTLYLAAVDSRAKVYTFEGSPEIAGLAQQNFNYLNANNIQLIEGNLDETLLPQTEKVSQIDFAFFDANHRYEPTLRYFDICLQKATPDSVFIFDDIYWSKSMQQAWQIIQNHPQVTLSIDLFYLGIIFFRKDNLEKEHFKLKF